MSAWRHLLCAPCRAPCAMPTCSSRCSRRWVFPRVHPGIGQPHPHRADDLPAVCPSSRHRAGDAVRRDDHRRPRRTDRCRDSEFGFATLPIPAGGATGGADALLLDPRGDCAGSPAPRSPRCSASGWPAAWVRRAVRGHRVGVRDRGCLGADALGSRVGSVESSSQLLLLPSWCGPAIHRHGAGRIVSCMARSVCPLPARVAGHGDPCVGSPVVTSAARVWP